MRNFLLLQLIGGDLDGVKKERQIVRSKIKQLEDPLKAIDKDIQSLQDDLTALNQKREKAYQSIQQLRKQRDEGVCPSFFWTQKYINFLFLIFGTK